MGRGSLAERALLIAGRTELAAEAVGLLEVVTEDLLDLRHPVADDPLQPGGEVLVEGRSESFRGRAVGGFADEDVLEPVGDFAGDDLGRGADEVPSRERLEPAGHAGPRPLGRQLDDRAAMEDLALDRASLEHVPLRARRAGRASR